MTEVPSARLRSFITALERCGADLDAGRAAGLLDHAELSWEDVAPYVEERPGGYTRRRVARCETFEMLVMTWRPGQGSVPHDHAGSSCTMRVFRGRVTETHYRLAADSLVDPSTSSSSGVGEVVLDPGEAIHLLANEATAPETLVTLHVYAPPLPELRRYAPRPPATRPHAVFRRARHAHAPAVVVVGGGFSGTMVAAHLLRGATAARRPLHVVLLDRHSSVGEGPAYRTVDARHLLNVPAGRMSAWPDRPSDFLDWARARDGGVSATDFLPRRTFGEYVRETMFATAASAAEGITAEIRQEDVREISEKGAGWRLKTTGGATIGATAVVLATGHRPPDDPFGARWTGSRARLIADPWASLALTAIGPDEPVAVLGSGLTTIDVLLSLGSEPRSAPITAVSRRGLLPAPHASTPVTPVDPTTWVTELLAVPGGPPALLLLRTVLAQIEAVSRTGGDWRSVIDGLRPHTAALWRSLSPVEAERWMRHLRPFWEVHRHRTAPSIAETVRRRQEEGAFRAVAGRVLSAEGGASGATLQIRRRGATATEPLHVGWVINCTGPGVDARTRTEPAIASLVDAGHLRPDTLGLGVLTGPHGEALSGVTGRTRDDLIVVGTLRKPQLWESTAVPELRVQAAEAAASILEHLHEKLGAPAPSN